MRWNWIDLVVAATLTAAVAGTMWFRTFHGVDTSEEAYQRLQKGMTPAEVEVVVGTPGERRPIFWVGSHCVPANPPPGWVDHFWEENSVIGHRYAGPVGVIETYHYGRRGAEPLTEVTRKAKIHPIIYLGIPGALVLFLLIAEFTRSCRLYPPWRTSRAELEQPLPVCQKEPCDPQAPAG